MAPQVHPNNNDDDCNETLPPDCDPQEIDALLSKELMQLSFTDRNNISEEVHGVRSLAIEETPCVQDEALARLQYELVHCIPPSEKKAFDTAQSYSITYVNDRNFRLRFLRAELFDAKLAAQRLTTYLDLLLKLFGMEVLKRPLRTKDFKSKDEKSALRGGLVQLLPYRDRSGRRVMVIMSDIMSHNHVMRVCFVWSSVESLRVWINRVWKKVNKSTAPR